MGFKSVFNRKKKIVNIIFYMLKDNFVFVNSDLINIRTHSVKKSSHFQYAQFSLYTTLYIRNIEHVRKNSSFWARSNTGLEIFYCDVYK